MAVAITQIARFSLGNKRAKIVDLTLSGNYATGGEALTARTLGFKKLEFVCFNGPAVSTDLATSNPVSYDYSTAKLVSYESGASGTASAEKTNSEAYATGSHVRALCIGYGG